MYRAIAYKEWLKIRWTFAAMAVVGIAALTNITLDIMHDLRFEQPNTVWYYVVFNQYIFYGLMRYVPLLTGVAVALAQFVPEMVGNRLKLTLHLPVRENTGILWMLSVGGAAVLLLFVAEMAVLAAVTGWFFPLEVVLMMLLTVDPWFLAGIAGYVLVATIVLDYSWLRRAALIVIAYGVIDALVLRVPYGAYGLSLPFFAVLILLLCVAPVLSAHRFRRGVR